MKKVGGISRRAVIVGGGMGLGIGCRILRYSSTRLLRAMYPQTA